MGGHQTPGPPSVFLSTCCLYCYHLLTKEEGGRKESERGISWPRSHSKEQGWEGSSVRFKGRTATAARHCHWSRGLGKEQKPPRDKVTATGHIPVRLAEPGGQGRAGPTVRSILQAAFPGPSSQTRAWKAPLLRGRPGASRGRELGSSHFPEGRPILPNTILWWRIQVTSSVTRLFTMRAQRGP